MTAEQVRAALAPAKVGDQVQFAPHQPSWWWTVRARDERFIVATHQAPFHPAGTLVYTVVDLTGWQRTYNGVGPGVVRSSLNTLGGGLGLGPNGEGCVDALAGLVSGEWTLSVRRVAPVEEARLR